LLASIIAIRERQKNPTTSVTGVRDASILRERNAAGKLAPGQVMICGALLAVMDKTA